MNTPKKQKRVKADAEWLGPEPLWTLPRTAADYDAMVEQMAKAMAEFSWKGSNEEVRNYWRHDAKRALRAIGITRPKE